MLLQAAQKARKEQLRREGKLLTGKAKEQAERLAAMRERLLQQAAEKGIDLTQEEAEAEAEKKPKKVGVAAWACVRCAWGSWQLGACMNAAMHPLPAYCGSVCMPADKGRATEPLPRMLATRGAHLCQLAVGVHACQAGQSPNHHPSIPPTCGVLACLVRLGRVIPPVPACWVVP